MLKPFHPNFNMVTHTLADIEVQTQARVNNLTYKQTLNRKLVHPPLHPGGKPVSDHCPGGHGCSFPVKFNKRAVLPKACHLISTDL